MIMKFYSILFQKYRFISVFLLCVLFAGVVCAQKNTDNQAKTVNLNVVDDNGNPIPKARVELGESLIHFETDENGALSFVAFPNDYLTISSSGYEKTISLVKQILLNKNIKLIKSKLYMTSDDEIPLPFVTLKKRNISGNANVIRSSQLKMYPSTDIRNAFTGLATGLEVLELNGQSGTSPEEKSVNYGIEKIRLSSRGRPMKCVIDDNLSDLSEIALDPGEIESVTVIKDITAKAMFGPAAADGIIFIKTRRGNENKRDLYINIEDGVNIIDRMPGWVSGATYAGLNNEARENNGLTPNYSADDIAAYGQNKPYDLYHPNINFRDMILKTAKSFTRANIALTGGNDVLKYFSYLGYNGEGDVYKIGPKSDYNRISLRSNLDVQITDNIKAQLNFSGTVSYFRNPNYLGASSESSSNFNLLPFNAIIDDITTIPPIAFPIYASYDTLNNVPWYGVSSTYKSNPIGNITDQGYFKESDRMGVISTVLDYDMNYLVKGLKSKTYLDINTLNLVRLGKAENYIAYIATPSISPKTGNDTINLSLVHNGTQSADESNLHDYYSQGYTFYENLSYNREFGSHNILSTLTYYRSRTAVDGIESPNRQQNVVWTGVYSYNDKYTFQGVLNYAGCASFGKGEKYELFPSIGASWVISEENFMSTQKIINYLKLRAESGILGYEGFIDKDYYRYYQDNWSRSTGSKFGPFSTNQWFGSTSESSPYTTTLSRMGNPVLTWEKRKEFSVGLDALMFDQKLSLEVTYYNNLRDGQITQVQYVIPYLAGISSSLPIYNYNKTRYFGIESGIQFTNSFGGFEYSIGGNATFQNSKVVKYDEPNYRSDYQRVIGKPADSYWGLTYLGKFKTDAEALETPQIFDAVLHAGDLKYADMNDDGFVDENDQSAIGHADPRMFYALNARFSFRNFEMTVIGTGRAFYDLALTNRYYWNGWGDNTYSNFVKDNINGAYPNLTYYKVNNNFVNSNFWLTEGGYFKIQNVELAYYLPAKMAYALSTRGIRIYLRGANLFTMSKIKDVDPESINSGVEVYPLFKTFSGGIKFTF